MTNAADARYGLYFGMLLGLLLYNLLLFVSSRERIYLIFVAFVASMGLCQAVLTGLDTRFPWPGWAWWNSAFPLVALALAALSGLQFARSFLSSPSRMPRVDKLIIAQAGGWALSVLAAVVLSHSAASSIVGVLAAISLATMLLAGVISMGRGFPGARFFSLAWALLLAGVLAWALHDTGALPSNAFTANGLLIGSALQVVLLSFALGDRSNVTQRFKEQAQARLAAEHAMVQALSESQERLRTVLQEREIILESSMVGIAFLTASGRLRWANQAMRQIFGTPPGVMFSSMEQFHLSRDHYLRIGDEVAAAVKRGDVYERELQVRRFDGTPIWISLSGKAVRHGDLRNGTVWVIMNITQRKELEAQLQKSSSEREAILNNAVVGIVLSVNRRHEWVNEKFAQMLGYSRESLMGQGSEAIHADLESWRRFGEEARAALIETGSLICERQLRRRSGDLFWVEIGGSCVRPRDPDSGVIWTFLDITDRKRSEAEMREALEQQKTLNALRSRFVAMTSHEFRTPLAAILSAEELLRHYGDRLPDAERSEVLDGIAAGVQRMSRMMDRVLLIGRADAGMLDFRPAPLRVRELCRQLVDEARAQQPLDPSPLSLVVAEDVTPGRYDEKLLRHIFSNLLSNALKYSPAGGEVRFDVRHEGPDILFEVSDQGIGIPPEEIPHLFESFHRASNVGAIQGTGLGLAIVKNAVDMHGGTIEVRSRLGSGTTFLVRLPRSEEEALA